MVYRAYDAVDRRLGFCYVNNKCLTDKVSYFKTLNAFRSLDIFILRCEYLWHRESFEYFFMSPHVRKVAEGEKIPEYYLELLIDKENRDKKSHQLTEVKRS